jgi:hypothetical protein
MSIPEQPPTFRTPTPAERPWWWRLEDSAGAEVAAATVPVELVGQRFASQADAESWVGEIWASLAEVGVAAVTLFDLDREVYGPMSLSA